MRASTQSVFFEKTLDDVSGRIEIRLTGEKNELTQILELRHRDGTLIRNEMGFSGKTYALHSLVEGVFDAPSVFRGNADVVSDDAVVFRNLEWMDTPVPDFRERIGSCALAPADVPKYDAFSGWKPRKKVRIKNVKSLEILAEFFRGWREDLLQDMAVSNPPQEDGSPGLDIPALVQFLQCLSACTAAYLAGMAGVIMAIGSSVGSVAVGAIVATGLFTAAYFLCQAGCHAAFWFSKYSK